MSFSHGNPSAPKYDGAPRRETPCERCGWGYQGFHICFDASIKVEGEGLVPRPKKSGEPTPDRRKSDSHRRALAESANARWAAHREATKERDAQLIEAYKEGSSYLDLMTEFKLSKSTIINIMHRARDEGRVVIRPKNISR